MKHQFQLFDKGSAFFGKPVGLHVKASLLQPDPYTGGEDLVTCYTQLYQRFIQTSTNQIATFPHCISHALDNSCKHCASIEMIGKRVPDNIIN